VWDAILIVITTTPCSIRRLWPKPKKAEKSKTLKDRPMPQWLIVAEQEATTPTQESAAPNAFSRLKAAQSAIGR
jgi:hypothetical protein